MCSLFCLHSSAVLYHRALVIMVLAENDSRFSECELVDLFVEIEAGAGVNSATGSQCCPEASYQKRWCRSIAHDDCAS